MVEQRRSELTLLPQESESTAARITSGRVTTDQRQRLETGQPAEFLVVGLQEFAAPNFALRTVADAVAYDRQHRSGMLIVGHHCGGVGVVMLHFHQRHLPLVGHPVRVSGTQILRVHIRRDPFRLNSEQMQQVVARPFKMLIGGRVFEIAHVLTEDHFVPTHDGHRILKLSADTEAGRRVAWRVSTRGTAARSHVNGARTGGLRRRNR